MPPFGSESATMEKTRPSLNVMSAEAGATGLTLETGEEIRTRSFSGVISLGEGSRVGLICGFHSFLRIKGSFQWRGGGNATMNRAADIKRMTSGQLFSLPVSI